MQWEDRFSWEEEMTVWRRQVPWFTPETNVKKYIMDCGTNRRYPEYPSLPNRLLEQAAEELRSDIEMSIVQLDALNNSEHVSETRRRASAALDVDVAGQIKFAILEMRNLQRADRRLVPLIEKKRLQQKAAVKVVVAFTDLRNAAEAIKQALCCAL